jgi:hypothetical protein
MRRKFRLLALALGALAVLAAPANSQEMLMVHVDQARIMKMPERTATIVIGNPLIADATLQGGGMLVITGKGYGATNLVALDRSGRILMNRNVQVVGPNDSIVFVHRGMERETYSCAPDCDKRITLGDSPAYFNATLTQTGTRNGQAATAPASK